MSTKGIRGAKAADRDGVTPISARLIMDSECGVSYENGRSHAEHKAAPRLFRVPHLGHSVPPLAARTSNTPARVPTRIPAAVADHKAKGRSDSNHSRD